MPPQPAQSNHDRDKVIALLKSLGAECEEPRGNGDHAWRRCRHCLAILELEDPAVRTLVRQYAAGLSQGSGK